MPEKTISSVEDLKERPHAAFNEIKELRNKEGVEFARFKQDCRKRALDLAHTEYTSNFKTVSDTEKNVIELADKYYNWLISIPESK